MRVALCATIFGGAGLSASYAKAPHVEIKDDRFSKEATLLGPMAMINPFGGTTRDWRLRTWVDKKSDVVRTQLYVNIAYITNGWRFYQTAADEDANALDVARIDSSVDSCRVGFFAGCSYSETLGIALDPAALIAHAQSGYAIKLSAKSGDDLILTVSPEQIALQLDAEKREVVALHGGPDPDAALQAEAEAGKAVPIAPSSRGASATVIQSPQVVLAAAREALQAEGFSLASPADASASAFTTVPLEKRLTMKLADCGRKWGIPYLIDHRTKTRLSVTVGVTGDQLTVQTGVTGAMVLGMGMEDVSLTCTSTGVYEAQLLAEIQKRLPTP